MLVNQALLQVFGVSYAVRFHIVVQNGNRKIEELLERIRAPRKPGDYDGIVARQAGTCCRRKRQISSRTNIGNPLPRFTKHRNRP